MTLFDDWNIEIEQEPFTCPCCGGDRYKSIFIETNKEQYKINRKASGLTTVSKIKRINILVSKDFAECLSCRYRKLLNKTETVVPKESKKEIADRLAQTRFGGEFLNPRPL